MNTRLVSATPPQAFITGLVSACSPQPAWYSYCVTPGVVLSPSQEGGKLVSDLKCVDIPAFLFLSTLLPIFALKDYSLPV